MNPEETLRAHQLAAFFRNNPRQNSNTQLKSLLADFVSQQPIPSNVTPPSEWTDRLPPEVKSRVLEDLRRTRSGGTHTPQRTHSTRSRTTERFESAPTTPTTPRLRDQTSTSRPVTSHTHTTFDEEIPRPDLRTGNMSARQFSDAEQSEITRIVATIMQARDGDFGGPRQPNWRDNEVGYFHPDCDNAQRGDSITVGTDVVFRDVNLFIDRLKDAVAGRSEDIVKHRIPSLLRGEAQMWYSTGLSDLEKTGLRHGSMESWYRTLSNQFKRPLSEALRLLGQERYTLLDTRNRRPVAQHFYAVQRHARDAGFTSAEHQLTYAFNGIDVRLRQTMREPGPDDTVAKFTSDASSRRDTWAELAEVFLGRGGPQQSGTKSAGSRGYSGQQNAPPYYYYPSNPPSYTQPQPNANRYGSQNQKRLPAAPQQSRLPAPPQRLAIMPAASSNTRRNLKPFASRSHHLANSEFEDHTGYEEGELDQHDVEGAHYAEHGDGDQGEMYYADEEEHQVNSYYLNPPLHECRTCGQGFHDQQALFYHVRTTKHAAGPAPAEN